MRIATWNINSVRLRAGLVVRLIEEFQPDVICLQETKCPPGQFPTSAFSSVGFDHIADNGYTGHHGVAIVSRLPLTAIEKHDFCGRQDGRHVSAIVANTNTTVHSIYVPAGGDEPCPSKNPKFAHKLEFLDEMKTWAKSHLHDPTASQVFTGDFNVAPLESDVWSHKQLLKVVSHTPEETTRLGAIKDSCALHDPIRARYPEPEKLYTWWSYRSQDWQKSNRGRRLDHIWVSGTLASSCSKARILTSPRSWERPSDHAPVMVDLT